MSFWKLTERFTKEREYLHNVSRNTLDWYRDSFKAFAPILEQDFASTGLLKAALV
jgi:hypothetical protein